jgi:thioredoxin reductase (NADPH)
MLDRVKSNKKIRLLANRVVNKWVGSKNTLSGVEVSDPKDPKKTEIIPCEAGFIAIGHRPNTKFLKNQVRFRTKYYCLLVLSIIVSVVVTVGMCVRLHWIRRIISKPRAVPP